MEKLSLVLIILFIFFSISSCSKPLKSIRPNLNTTTPLHGQRIKIDLEKLKIPSKEELRAYENIPSKKPLLIDSEQKISSLPPYGAYIVLRNDALMKIMNLFSLQVGNEINAYTSTPDQSGSTSDVSYTFSKFLYDVDLYGYKISSPGASQIKVTWTSFSFLMQWNFHICAHDWPHPCDDGWVQVFTTTNNGVELDITFTLTTSGPKVQLAVTSVSLVSSHGEIEVFVDCTSFICLIPVDDIANAIAGAFIGTFTAAVQKVANQEAAQLVNNIATSIPFPSSNLILNMQGGVTLLPASGNPNLVIYGLGAFSPLHKPQNPPFSPTVSPPDSVFLSPSGEFEVVYTDYLLLSAIWAENLLGTFNRTVDYHDIPSNSPIQLTTDNSFFLQSIPGLTKFPHMNITAQTWLATLPSIQTSTAGVVANVPLRCHFTLANSTYSHEGFIVDLAIGFVATITSSMPNGNSIQVTPTLKNYTVVTTQVASAVGSISTALWNAFLSYALNSLSPQVPGETIVIPSEFTASGVFDNLETKYGLFGTSSISYAVKVPQVVCSSTRSCSVGNTCCNWGGQWGCCTAPSANCCSQGCCLKGSSCCGQGECC